MESVKKTPLALIHPVDWAINFAWSKKFTLFYLSLPCFLSEIITSYVGYNYPLSDRETVIITVLSGLPTAWIIGAIVLFTIQSCRGFPFELGTITLQAFGYLPKVFFSYVAVFFIILFAVTNPIFVIFILFFVWAPAFAVCDIFATTAHRTQDEDLDIEYEDDDFIIKPKKTSILFSAPWNIGFIRSINLASRDWLPTLLMCGFFWLAVVTPSAMTYLIVGKKISSTFIIVQHLLTTFSMALALGIWAALFVIVLPQQAKEELKIPSTINLWEIVRGKKIFYFYGKLIPLALSLVIGLSATTYILYQTKSTKDFPANAKVQISDAHIDGDQLVLRLIVDDEEDEMRWLLPSQFQIVSENPDNKIETPAASGIFSFLSPKVNNAVSPNRDTIVAYDRGGQELGIDSLSPRSDPVELVLRYQLKSPEDKDKDFLLFYRNIVTGSQKGPLLRGTPKK